MLCTVWHLLLHTTSPTELKSTTNASPSTKKLECINNPDRNYFYTSGGLTADKTVLAAICGSLLQTVGPVIHYKVEPSLKVDWLALKSTFRIVHSIYKYSL